MFLYKGELVWSIKHKCCKQCGTCDIPHKGNGLCLRCHDKKRSKGIKRQLQMKEIRKRYYEVIKKWKLKTSHITSAIQYGRKRQKQGKFALIYRGYPVYFVGIDDIGRQSKEKRKKFEDIKEYIDRQIIKKEKNLKIKKFLNL